LDNSSILNKLDELAEESFKKGNLEGYLVASIIYQQLCEQLVRLLIRDAHFLIQLAVFPISIEFRVNERATFGQLIDELKSTLDFNDKEAFIQKCEMMNKFRIDVVHHLTKKQEPRSSTS